MERGDVQAGLSGKCHSLEVREGTAKTSRIVIWLHIAGSAMHMGIEESRNGLEGWRSERRAWNMLCRMLC